MKFKGNKTFITLFILSVFSLVFVSVTGCTGQKVLPVEETPDLRPVKLFIAPRSSQVVAGQTKKFSINYLDFDGNYQIPKNVLWSSSRGRITEKGVFYAPDTAGNYMITAEYQGVFATTDINVIPNNLPWSIEIIPETLEVMVGSRIPLKLKIINNAGIDLDYRGSWYSSNGVIEVIEKNYSPGKNMSSGTEPLDFRANFDKFNTTAQYYAPIHPCTELIKATLTTGETAHAVFEIVKGPPVKMAIIPRNIAVSPGSQQVFTAIVYDQYDNPSYPDVLWSANNGWIDQRGVYRAPNTGGETIISAKYLNVSKTAAINNAALGEPIRIEISPSSGSLSVNSTLLFTAVGYDENNNRVNLTNPQWSTDNGSITNMGFYSSYNAAVGTATIRVTQSGVVSEVQITITSN